jgi:hypothetical protein
MNPVYAITSNTEISYGEKIGFLRYKIYILENNSCSKIYHVEKKCFFSVVQYKIMFISYHSNMSEKQDIFVFLSFLLSFYEFYLEYLNLAKFVI